MPPVYVFTNRKGIKKLEIPLEKLAKLVSADAAIQIQSPDVPLTDRVTNGVLQKMHETLIQRATRDKQTELVNRKEFIKKLEYELGKAKQFRLVHTLCYLEIDQIMLITNSCAVEASDALLKEVTSILTDEIADDSNIARLGDEAFGILMKNTTVPEAQVVAERLNKSIDEFQFDWEDKVFSLRSSIGLVPVTKYSQGVIDILKQAGNACSAAKTTGSNHIQVYAEDDENVKHHQQVIGWAGRIGKVLSENRIELRCQLIAPVLSGRNNHSHYEILLSIRDE